MYFLQRVSADPERLQALLLESTEDAQRHAWSALLSTVVRQLAPFERASYPAPKADEPATDGKADDGAAAADSDSDSDAEGASAGDSKQSEEPYPAEAQQVVVTFVEVLLKLLPQAAKHKRQSAQFFNVGWVLLPLLLVVWH